MKLGSGRACRSFVSGALNQPHHSPSHMHSHPACPQACQPVSCSLAVSAKYRNVGLPGIAVISLCSQCNSVLRTQLYQPYPFSNSTPMIYSTINFATVVIIVTALLAATNGRSRVSKGRLPPGPPPWGWFGNAWTVRRLSTAPNEICAELPRTWGDLVTLWLGSHPMVIINSPHAAHELFQKVSETHPFDSVSLML
jgi:hypothetical protein